MQVTTITVGVELQLTPEAEQVMQRIERAIAYFNKDTGPTLTFRNQAEADAAKALLDYVHEDGAHGGAWSTVDNIEQDGYHTTADLMRAYQEAVTK